MFFHCEATNKNGFGFFEANQWLPEGGPTDLDDAPDLHINKKHDDDDDDDEHDDDDDDDHHHHHHHHHQKFIMLI